MIISTIGRYALRVMIDLAKTEKEYPKMFTQKHEKNAKRSLPR